MSTRMVKLIGMPSFDFEFDQGPSPPYCASSLDPLAQTRRMSEKANISDIKHPTRTIDKETQQDPNGYSDGADSGASVTNIDMNLDGAGISSVNGDNNDHSDNTPDSPAVGRSSYTKMTLADDDSQDPNRASLAPLDKNGLPVNNSNGFTRAIINGENGRKTISIPPPISSNPKSTGPLTYNSSLMSTSDHSESSGITSPYSLPDQPTHPPPSIPLALPSSSSVPSFPAPSNPPPPPPTTLKHRHTLQVPKQGIGRVSSDGILDVAHSTGRFSPTTARRSSMTINRRNTQSIHSTIPHDEAPQDESAARWAEHIRQKRASRRRRKEDEEDDDRVVIGQRVDHNHVNWITAYNMLTGIRFTVSRTNAKLDRPLTDVDFEAKNKFSFDV